MGPTDTVNSIAFSPDGIHIVSASNDQTIQVWDALTDDVATVNSPLISLHPPSLSLHFHSNIFLMANFIFKQDGWITAFNVPFFWISPQFHVQFPYPHNSLVIGPYGTTSIDNCCICIGNTWSNCYVS